MNFVDALESLLPVVDKVYSRWEVDREKLYLENLSHPESPKVTCQKGCGACCHFPIIPATAGEAFVVLSKLLADDKSPEELHGIFLPYARRYFEYSRRTGSLPLTDQQQRNFLGEKLPCPLFTKTPETGLLGGHCGIFGFRPLICDFFHSLEAPELCLQKHPHGSFTNVMERGHDALDEIRREERRIFGRSALGHFPLLMASLLTEAGLKAFLRTQEPDEDTENSQDILDFGLYLELLECLGYSWGDDEWSSLAKAQSEMI